MAARPGAVAAVPHRAPAGGMVLGLVEEDPGALVLLGEAAHPDGAAMLVGEEVRGGDGDGPDGLLEVLALPPAKDVAGAARDDLAMGERGRELAVEERQIGGRRLLLGAEGPEDAEDGLAELDGAGEHPRRLRRIPRGAVSKGTRPGSVDQACLAAEGEQVTVLVQLLLRRVEAITGERVGEIERRIPGDELESRRHRLTSKMDLTG